MARHRLTAVLVGTLALCLLAGGTGAFLLGRHQAQVAGAASDVAGSGGPDSSQSQSPDGVDGDSAVPGTTAPAGPDSDNTDSINPDSINPDSNNPAPTEQGSLGPSADSDPSRSLPSSAPITESPDAVPANDREVRLSAAAAIDPQADEIRDLLQRHFDAINTGDYQLWAGTVTKDQVKSIPADRWRKEYSTTIDTGMSVLKIDPKTRQITVSFESRQAPQFAPDKRSTCVDWTVSLPITPVNGTPLIGRSLEDVAQHQTCSRN